jgi:hypothetical protein
LLSNWTKYSKTWLRGVLDDDEDDDDVGLYKLVLVYDFLWFRSKRAQQVAFVPRKYIEWEERGFVPLDR